MFLTFGGFGRYATLYTFGLESVETIHFLH
jgi:hypothetical protein